MFEEFTQVALTTDLPSYNLKAGDMGTIVDDVKHGTAYVIEFMTLLGETVAVVEVAPAQIRKIERGEIANLRKIIPQTGSGSG